VSTYVAIRSEGGLIPPDTLDKIAKEELPGQKASDFGLGANRRLSDEIARAWSDALNYWRVFQGRREELPESETGTTLTRRWVSHLLDEILGYQLVLLQPAPQIEGKPYPISHRVDEREDAPPVHIAGFRQNLDRRPESGRPRTSPQALVQEYLNRTEENLWGIVTNGLQLRLLRDSTRSSRPTYLEFDLAGILDGQRFNEFALLFRLCHRSRLPKTAEDAAKCLLEQYYQASIEEGARVRDHLRDGVEQALLLIGTGLLRHPDNPALRAAVESGELNAYRYYQQLLRLIYRLLFLMVAEERRMIVAQGPENDRTQRIYDENYSMRRLRDRAEQPIETTPYGDLWINLQQSFRLFDSTANPLGIPPLNGDLFGPEAVPDLEGTALQNHLLLEAIRQLSLFAVRGVRRRVNYAGVDVEELGSVYESLLDFQPVIRQDSGVFSFDLATGMERKTTGSYYTYPDLVGELIKSALVPVMEDRLAQAKTAEEKERVLLGLTVCDPASGSGHFLLAAARRIGRELARVRTGEEEPTPEEFRQAVRDVVRHCVYGVDVNPLAVDLCKLALWIEGHNVGLPLTFLDHRIKCGNSLIGIFDERPAEVPDEAFTAVTDDVKKVATAVRKRNRFERSPKGAQQLELVEPEPVDDADVNAYAQVAILPDDSPDHVHAKKHEYEEWQNSEAHQRRKLEADTWCAAFFWPLTEDAVNDWLPTTASYLQALAKPSSVPKTPREKIEALAQRHRFFHWCLEFPDVCAEGGFDVVLGNPPWERIKLQEKEFFAARDPEIAMAPNKAARDRLIRKLKRSIPALYADFQQALHDAEAESRFARQSGRFSLTARGDINTYALFADLNRALLHPMGRAGAVIPPGIATDDTTKVFFGDLLKTGTLVSLLGMDNEAMIYFPGIDHRNKFSLLTLGGRDAGVEAPVFTFSCRRLDYTALPERRFTLTDEEINLLNPNTHTCPVFRTRADAELTKSIYRRVPVLVREAREDKPEANPWSISFSTMFHMANDSNLFRTPGDFPNGIPPDHLPLYEAKLMHQFDHRWATYEGASQEELRKGLARDLTDHDKGDVDHAVRPRYWVPKEEVILRTSRVPPNVVRGYRTGNKELLGQELPYWLAGHHYRYGNSETANWVFGRLRFTDPFAAFMNTFHAQELEKDYPLTERDLKRIVEFCKQHEPSQEMDWFALARLLIESKTPRWLLGFRDVVSNIVQRTAISAVLPRAGAGHTLPLLHTQSEAPRGACLVANMNSLVLDFVTRTKLGGTHLSFFVLQQLPVLAPDRYTQADVDFIVPQVLELTYTAWDLKPFAEDLEYDGPPFTWDPDRRAILRAELDAYYAHLYGLNRKQLRYILDPHGLTDRELEDILDPTEDPPEAPRTTDFPGETFRVLKEKEIKKYGEYRTQRLVLEAWERMFGGR